MTEPTPLVDRGVGPEVIHSVPVALSEALVRVTAPNPSMMTGPGTNTYLVGTTSLIVVDPGPVNDAHLAALVAAIDGREVSMICVTHTHPDHAPGAAGLAALVDAPLAGFGPGPSFVPDRHLMEGDVLEVAGASLRVLHTPGHASDHLCYLLEDEALALTGDHVMHGSTVVIRPPDGQVAAYLDSLERLAATHCEVLAPAHGRLIGDASGAIDEVIGHRRAREGRIAEELVGAGRASAVELLGSVYPGLEERRTEIATVTLLAHLQHLEDLGRATCARARSEQSISSSFEAC